MRTLALCILFALVCSEYTAAQTYFEHAKKNWPTYTAVFISGMGNGLQDAVSSTALYDQTILPKWEEGNYWGPKDKTWVNKYAMDENGKPMLNKQAFLFSRGAFVAGTDIWHGAQFVSNTAWQIGTLTYKQTDNTLYKIIDFVALKVLYGAGWHTMNTILKKR